MRFKEVENQIRKVILEAHREIKDLAPQDSKYKSFYKGQMFDYIQVNNNPVYTNTNNLFNSVELKYEGIGFDKNITAITYVDETNVPYYERAVLRPQLRTVLTAGSRDYGDEAVIMPYYSEVEFIENRNYLYYMKARSSVQQKILSLNGSKFYIKDSLEDFK